MQKKDLPDGGWAHIRDADDITVRGRRGIRAISGSLGDAVLKELSSVKTEEDYARLHLTEEQVDTIMRLQEASLVAFLAGWSYDEPLPTIATVGDMVVDRYDALIALTAAGGAEILLDTDPTMEYDPKDHSGS